MNLYDNKNEELGQKRLRQKAFCNDKTKRKGLKTEWYGLKSSKTPKQVLVRNIRLKKSEKPFPEKITESY